MELTALEYRHVSGLRSESYTGEADLRDPRYPIQYDPKFAKLVDSLDRRRVIGATAPGDDALKHHPALAWISSPASLTESTTTLRPSSST